MPLSNVLTQKYSHLFKILDFDHDGMVQESDFTNLAENISIFRCVESNSPLDTMIKLRSKTIWRSIETFLQTEKLNWCNLENWLKFIDHVVIKSNSRAFDLFVQRAVQDIFHIYDKNKDEVLSKQEFLCFFVSLRVSIREADSCFKKLDLNKDQLISKNELFVAIHQYLLSEDIERPGNLLFGNSASFQFETRKSHLYA